MEQTTVSVVNQLTLAAAAIIACGVLWRAYKGAMDAVVAAKDKHLSDMREINQAGIFDLRARTMVLEDRAGVMREDRNKYIEPPNAKGKLALGDLDGHDLK
jgi:hypothetical protein